MWLFLLACTSGPNDSVGDSAATPAGFDGAVIAVQGDSALGFLGADGTLVGTLDLATEAGSWMVHNVQITPDGQTVVATAMAPMATMDTGSAAVVPDELVMVDIATESVVRRCEFTTGAGVAHVVTDGVTAWVTGYNVNLVYVVDLGTCGIAGEWPLPAGTGPHGIRRAAPDDPLGDGFYVAGMADGSLHRLDMNGNDTAWDLPGAAVQVAVLPDGSAVLVTLLDTVQIAWLDTATGTVAAYNLPEGAAGPAQIYPSPDSRSVWVADQGPAGGIAGHELFQLEAATGAGLARVVVNDAPHGVVVSRDGQTVWTTTLTLGTVDRVDVGSLSVVSSTMVGNAPNGISLSDVDGARP